MKHTITTTQQADNTNLYLTYEVHDPYVKITGTIPKNKAYNKTMTIEAARIHYRNNIQNNWKPCDNN